MTDNVIDFASRKFKSTDVREELIKEPPIKNATIAGVPIRKPRTQYEYIRICKKFLAKEDYDKILLCIMDVEYYRDAEKHIKKIVDCYDSFPRRV